MPLRRAKRRRWPVLPSGKLGATARKREQGRGTTARGRGRRLCRDGYVSSSHPDRHGHRSRTVRDLGRSAMGRVARCCLCSVAWFSYWFDNLGLDNPQDRFAR
ncbi:hypothetical protein VPH35_078315 [Triticum aestivum]|uniref:Uncharacterized protein n=1 Tax=Aegilops tauschii TaxID=37682 RepID=M8C6X2_AEGTA